MKTLSHNKQKASTGGRPDESASPTGKPVRYPNGDVQCTGWSDRIDLSVCIARNIRQPQKCEGCPLNY